MRWSDIVNPTVVRIALVFVLGFAIFDLILLGSIRAEWFVALMEATARVAASLMNATGLEASVLRNDITLSTRILRIDPDCTGLLIVGMYSALLVAYPVAWRTRMIGLAVGIPAILGANLFRLVAVGHASELLADEPFAFVHDYLFKVFMVAVVIALWAGWLAYARHQARR